jgi:hypothetical protein
MQKYALYDNIQKKKKIHWSDKYEVSVKDDGWYVVMDYHPELGFTNFYSSSGMEIASFRHYVQQFAVRYGFNTPVRLVMEAVIPGIPFVIANGIFNRRTEPADNVQFILTDVIPLQQSHVRGYENIWYTHQEYKKWSDRVTAYETFICQPSVAAGNLLKPKRVLGHYSNIDDILSLAESVIGDGEEGIIARAHNEKAGYAIKNENHFKIKTRIELDLLITSVEHTIGDKGNSGMILTLQDTLRNEYKVACNIDKYIANSSELVGKVAMIRAMEKLYNGSLRQPTFVCLRNDKKQHEID